MRTKLGAKLLAAVILLLPYLCHGAEDAFTDLLDFHGAPTGADDRSFNIFFDAGAWHGYSLVPEKDVDTGFTGPFIHSLGKGQWVGSYVGRLHLRDADTGRDLALKPDAASGHAAPGYLQRSYSSDELKVTETLFFADSWHALVRIELSAPSLRHIALRTTGRPVVSRRATVSTAGDQVLQRFAGTKTVLTTRLIATGATAQPARLTATEFSLALNETLTVGPDRPTVVNIEQAATYDNDVEHPAPVDVEHAWEANRLRWARYLAPVASVHLAGLPDDEARRMAAKAIVTLIGNWRAARGELLHDGVIPSYSDSNYNGFWAWDSWKHVAALASIAPELARDQMRAMFDYQTANGMVPDCIFLNKADNNARDSKPPLAGWAAWRLFQASGDRDFLATMYDKLVRYHRWWYAERDHDHNGLAEYGATDGTRVAAAWESGMDNAARFDDIEMLRNGPHAWSANQESVDLNTYLYEEKRDLANIAGVLGLVDERQKWLDEAESLKAVVQAQFYDAKLAYFFDRRLHDGALIRIFGPEGWIPLWAGLASSEQARHVAIAMTDPRKFATKMPFPSLAADDPRFSPVKGYWRGTVWIDQAYFAVSGLRRYGFGREADAMALRLVSSAQGLAAQTPFHEVYDPLTGHGLHAPNFSWSAAHFFMLLVDSNQH
ncbi:MAG: hypothetical protein JO006_06660 [Paucibacter sp.]|nr:hypothetical protein [Roseateles sp.]